MGVNDKAVRPPTTNICCCSLYFLIPFLPIIFHSEFSKFPMATMDKSLSKQLKLNILPSCSSSLDDDHTRRSSASTCVTIVDEQQHEETPCRGGKMGLIKIGRQRRVLSLEGQEELNCQHFDGAIGPQSSSNNTSTLECHSCEHQRRRDRRAAGFCARVQSLSQIVHLRIKNNSRRQDSYLFNQSSFEMEENENEKPGLKEMLCGRRMREWAFWFIVIFLAGLTIRDVANLIKEYSGNPKKSDMNVRFNETMNLPNITFCMSRAQAWSHFRLNGTESGAEWEEQIKEQLQNMTDREHFLSQPWGFEMVMETYNLISTLTSMERETTAHGSVNSIHKFRTQERLGEIRKITMFWLAELEKRGLTFEEFVQKVGKETLRRSMQRFQRTSFDEDEVIKTQLTITWLSQMQLCFQPVFDKDNFKPITDQGQFFVMVLSHNAEKLDGQQVDCMSVDFHGRPSSSTRFMGSKGVIKDGFTDELCMGMMHDTTVEVKALYKMLPNDDEGTACREQEEDKDNEYDCHLRCRMKFIRDICHCTGPTLSYLAKGGKEEMEKWPLCDYSKCKVDVQARNYSDQECTAKCFRDCDQIRYNVIHEKKGRSVRSDLTTVVLNWGSFEYLTLEQDWVWSATTFISAIGGSIGMWLGLSILSLIQGSTYAYSYVTDNVIKKRRKRQVSICEHPENKISQSEEAKVVAKNPFASPFKKMSTAHSTENE